MDEAKNMFAAMLGVKNPPAYEPRHVAAPASGSLAQPPPPPLPDGASVDALTVQEMVVEEMAVEKAALEESCASLAAEKKRLMSRMSELVAANVALECDRFWSNARICELADELVAEREESARLRELVDELDEKLARLNRRLVASRRPGWFAKPPVGS